MMHHHADPATPDRPRPDQEEAFDGLLLAMLARKRLLVLVGSDCEQRLRVLRRVVDHIAADGTLVLTATAQPESEVEDLIAAGAIAAGAIGVTQDHGDDLDALVATLEDRLERAGAGLLAIDGAHLLSTTTLSDLGDLSLSESPAGRFLQVLLCGDPDLEHSLARPAMTAMVRDIGVIYRLDAGADGSVAPRTLRARQTGAADDNAPSSGERDRGAGKGADGNGRAALRGGRHAPPLASRAAVAAGVGLMLAAGVAGASFYLPSVDPGAVFHTVRGAVVRAARAVAEDAGALADVVVTPLAGASGDDPAPPDTGPIRDAGGESDPPPPPPRPPAGPPRGVPADTPEPGVPAAPPDAASAQIAALAAMSPPGQPAAASPPDAAARARIAGLAETAQRQLAAKRLTTPPGDNAFETIQAIRSIDPSSPQARGLAAEVKDIYRRWAALEERDGDWTDAQRFYERALSVDPADEEVIALLRRTLERQGDGPARTSVAGAATGAVAAAFTSPEAAAGVLEEPAALQAILDNGDADRRLADGRTLLMVAAERGLADAARRLLRGGAGANQRSADGSTPVMYAAWYGHADLITLLGAAGADPDTRDNNGKTPLMAAAARGNEAAVRALLDRGVTVGAAADHGWTALMYAANGGHDGVVRLLIGRGADPFRTDDRGNSAYSLSALQGHTRVVETLQGR